MKCLKVSTMTDKEARPPYRFFDFTEDRCKERPGRILGDYAG